MKKAIRLVLFIALIFVINTGLNFIFGNATEPHRLQNHELYANRNEYELLALGPSDCMSHFDAPEASKKLGIDCFNYGQAGTSYTVGAVKSSFENALSCQKPKTILFFVSHDNLYKDLDIQESAKTFIHATPGMTNKLAELKYYLRASEKDGALERIFQWKFIMGDEEMPAFSEMKENLKNKLSSEYRSFDINWRNSIQDSTIYVGNGFVANVNRNKKEPENKPQYTVDLTGYDVSSLDITADGHDLDTMLKICRKKGIKPYVIMGPLSLELICEEGALYDEKSETLRAIAEKNDVEYFDLNYIKSDYFRPTYEEWSDDKHLNIDGAKRYTDALCDILISAENGEDTDKFFYSNFAEMLKSYDNVEVLE